MEVNTAKTSFAVELTQVAWVVKDITIAENLFKTLFGVNNFGSPVTIRSQEFEGTYFGKPSDAEWLVSIAYSGGSFIELIQPLSGQSIFQDYLDKNPAGGVQHIAYTMPFTELDEAITELTEKGYPVITSLNMPVAKIVFVDTYKDLGVVTELMGLAEAGLAFVEKLKTGTI
jgi:methylmalonyl-CoA/ethylmalonyl-CoA epimerase